MPARPILLGVIGRPHGVRGHVHVQSYAARPEDLAAYTLRDEAGRGFTLRWIGGDVAEIGVMEGGIARPLPDRTAAERLTRLKLFVDRADLPPPEAEEFYLADLVGLDARDDAGRGLGRVTAVHDYGAGASLEIGDAGQTLLLPFTRACVPSVDLAAGWVTVCPPDELIVADQAMAAAP